MSKHATVTICIENDGSSIFHKAMNVLYEDDIIIKNVYTDLFQHTAKIYSNITFNASTENIVRILQNECIVELLYR